MSVVSSNERDAGTQLSNRGIEMLIWIFSKITEETSSPITFISGSDFSVLSVKISIFLKINVEFNIKMLDLGRSV